MPVKLRKTLIGWKQFCSECKEVLGGNIYLGLQNFVGSGSIMIGMGGGSLLPSLSPPRRPLRTGVAAW